jgi:hypothetical protein
MIASEEPIVAVPVGCPVGGRVKEPPIMLTTRWWTDFGLRVLVLVDQVLRERLLREPIGLRLHPTRDERREVERGVAVQVELVVHELIGGVGVHALGREPVLGHVVGEGPRRVGGRVHLVGVDLQLVHGGSSAGP